MVCPTLSLWIKCYRNPEVERLILLGEDLEATFTDKVTGPKMNASMELGKRGRHLHEQKHGVMNMSDMFGKSQG